MSDNTRVCAFEDCGCNFKSKTHNQKYCCDEHLKEATNRRTMARYYQNKARKQGAVRLCQCGTVLSRYNVLSLCSKCETKIEAESKAKLLRMLGK